MNDKRGWLAVGKRVDGAFVWYDDIRRQDAFDINDVVYDNGSVCWVKSSPLDRCQRKFVDVTDEFIDKYDADWAEYCDLDDTYEDVRRATR